MDRRTIARRSLQALLLSWVVLFVAMAIGSFTTRSSPTSAWLLPFGCLASTIGAHVIYFRHEDSEFFSQERAKYGLETASQSRLAMVLFGILTLLLGSLFIYRGLQSIGR